MKTPSRAAMRAIAGAKIVVAAALVVLACRDITIPESRSSARPALRSNIVDAVHSGGTPHFYFLTPMVSAPGYSGVFDGSIKPSVDICVVSGGVCASVVATYSTTSGVAGDILQINVADQSYKVNWNTRSSLFSGSTAYRIRVRVLQTELGHADVQLVNNGREAKNSDSGDLITLVDGSTLPIRFRIEVGAVAPVGAAGGSVKLNDGAVALSFPAGATSGDIAVTATPVPTSTVGYDASVLGGTVYEFRPSPTAFAQPVSLSLTYPNVLPTGVKASRLSVCKMIGSACVPLPRTRVDLATHTVTALVGSFSDYAVTPFPEICYLESSGNGSWLHTDSIEQAMPSCDGDWSPNGSQLAYQSGNGYRYSVHVVNADGTGDRALPDSAALTFNQTVAGVRCPRWSPDGTKILVDAGARPEVISADGSAIIKFESIFAALMPSNSPDAIGGVIPVWATDWCAERWSPDGRQIAFRGTHRGIQDVNALFVMNADGSDVRPLVTTTSAGDFRWSTDGSKFAFYAEWAGDIVGSGIYVMNADGSGLRLAFPGTSEFQWSPVRGDNRILFASCGDPYGETQCAEFGPGIWIVNADGSGGRLVVARGSSLTLPYDPHWSPDARRISVEWWYGPIPLDDSAGNPVTTYMLNTDGSGLQLVLGTSRAGAHALWRP